MTFCVQTDMKYRLNIYTVSKLEQLNNRGGRKKSPTFI